MSLFEILMLVCFGISWPISIYKSIKVKQVQGKSVIFMFIVLSGYVFGIIHKLLFLYDKVILLYMLNSILVSIDICLWFKYNKKVEPCKF